jgi:L-arabinokinase
MYTRDCFDGGLSGFGCPPHRQEVPCRDGLGHLTRSLEIATELRALDSRVEFVVATTIPEARVARGLAPPFDYRAVDYEPGTLQRSCFELDVTGTRAAYRRFLGKREERLEQEKRFLRASGCTAVVSDIPALPIRAGRALGLPAIGISNFTWDWILEPLFAGSEVEDTTEILADDYAQGTLHLRLPFGPATSPFPRSEAAPLVSRRATLSPLEVRRRLRLPLEDDRFLVIVCPGGWEPHGWNEIHVPECSGFRFVTVGDLPISADAPLHALAHDLPTGIAFTDLVAAADLVLAKPGYGIASECAAHRTALVAIERTHFRETPLLLDACRRMGPSCEISLLDFFSGDWEGALSTAIQSGVAWAPPPADGAGQVARRLAELLDLRDSRPAGA